MYEIILINLTSTIPLLLILTYMIMHPINNKSIIKYYQIGLLLTIFLGLTEISLMANTSIVINTILNGIHFLLMILIGYYINLMILHKSKFKVLKAVLIMPIIIFILLLILNLKYHFIFIPNQNNNILLGTYYWIPYAFLSFYLSCALIGALNKKHEYLVFDQILLIGSLIWIICSIIIQVNNPSFVLINYTISIFYIIYLVILRDLNLRRDSATSVFNRFMYDLVLKKYDHKKDVIIITVDVNYLKMVNDQYGHLAGDLLLQAIGKSLKKAFHHHGYIYRVGGDEFCILINDYPLQLIANDFQKIEKSLHTIKQQYHIKQAISYGYVLYNYQEGSIYDAVNQADMYMYKYKQKVKQIK